MYPTSPQGVRGCSVQAAKVLSVYWQYIWYVIHRWILVWLSVIWVFVIPVLNCDCFWYMSFKFILFCLSYVFVLCVYLFQFVFLYSYWPRPGFSRGLLTSHWGPLKGNCECSINRIDNLFSIELLQLLAKYYVDKNCGFFYSLLILN